MQNTLKNIILISLLFCPFILSAQQKQKPLRVGVAGLTHGHVVWILEHNKTDAVEVVGIAEPDRNCWRSGCQKNMGSA